MPNQLITFWTDFGTHKFHFFLPLAILPLVVLCHMYFLFGVVDFEDFFIKLTFIGNYLE